MWLTRFSISRPVITAMVFIALAIFGTISFYRIGRSANPPNTDFPIVVVYADYPGASPQEMERLDRQADRRSARRHRQPRPDERHRAGRRRRSIVVQFKLGTNLDIAAINVQSGVDTARVYLPTDLDPPSVEKNGASQPLLDHGGQLEVDVADALADFVNNRSSRCSKASRTSRPSTFTARPIASSTSNRFRERLVGANATLRDIFAAVAANNANLPGGILRQPTQETSVSVHAEINTAQDLLGIPLMVPGSSNKNMKIGDVAVRFRQPRRADVDLALQRSSRASTSSWAATSAADEITSTKVAREQIKKIEEQFPEVSLDRDRRPGRLHAKVAQRRLAIAHRGHRPDDARDAALPARVA